MNIYIYILCYKIRLIYSIAPRIPPGRFKGLAAYWNEVTWILILLFWVLQIPSFCSFHGRYQHNMYWFLILLRPAFSLIFSFGAQLGSRCLWRSISGAKNATLELKFGIFCFSFSSYFCIGFKYRFGWVLNRFRRPVGALFGNFLGSFSESKCEKCFFWFLIPLSCILLDFRGLGGLKIILKSH